MTVLGSPLRPVLRSPLYSPLVGKWGGNAALEALRGKQGFAIVPAYDAVAVVDLGTPANNFCGSMAQALAAGILVNPSPPTKMLFNSSGILTSGSNLRCQYSAAGVPLGFLPEPQRQNIFTRSEELDHANWSKFSLTVTANAIISPDGTTNADKLVEAAATALHGAQQFVSFTSGVTYLASISFKAGERGFGWIALPSAAFSVGMTLYVNLNTGAVATVVGSPAVYGVIPEGNGWYRAYIAHTATATAGGNVPFGICAADGVASYAGDGTSGAYAWGAQLEAGLFPTSYIKTEASAVTRAADNLYVDLSKIPFSATVGTAIATAQPGADTDTNNFGLVQFDDGTANNRLVMTNGTAGEKRARQIVLNGGSVTANIVSAANAAASRYKQAMAWATNDIEMVVNGTTHTIDTSCAVPTGLAYMRIGRTTTGSTEWAAPIESIVYIPERLSQADMIARTS